ANVVCEAEDVVDMLAANPANHIIRLETGPGRGTGRFDIAHHWCFRGENLDLSKCFSHPRLCFGDDWPCFHTLDLGMAALIALKRDRNRLAFTSHDSPRNTFLAHAAKSRDRLFIDRQDAIPRS